jgi:hypothetical protein
MADWTIRVAQSPIGFGTPYKHNIIVVVDPAGRAVYEINGGPLGADGNELFKRTGSTSSDAVPSPDAATGDQMRTWARQLRLGPQAARLPPTPDSSPPSVSAPMQFGSIGAAAPNSPNDEADAFA